MRGIFSLLCVCFFLFLRLRISQRRKKDRGVKFCIRVRLLSREVFSHFGELWIAGSDGNGITSEMSCIEVAVGQTELGLMIVGHLELRAGASRKAVWWDLRLASLLTHLFCTFVAC